MVHPEVKNWIRYASFEERQGFVGKVTLVISLAIFLRIFVKHKACVCLLIVDDTNQGLYVD